MPTSLRDVDRRSPVNWRHPRNRGLVAWWLALPGTDGGPAWYDLAGTRHGVLQGMTAAGAGWTAGGPVPGARRLAFTGSAGPAVALPANSVPTGPCTVACWVTPAAIGSYLSVFAVYTSDADGCEILIDPSGSVIAGNWNDRATSAGGAAVAGVPLHVALTNTGTATALLVNGLVVGTSILNYATPGITGYWGQRPGASLPFNGTLAAGATWGRALSQAEVQADYDLSRRGYPGVLNRRAAAYYAASGSATPRHNLTLLGCGS